MAEDLEFLPVYNTSALLVVREEYRNISVVIGDQTYGTLRSSSERLSEDGLLLTT